ncbi:DUF4328 domain-containing protein [uncultured Cardiobacterium sp.]|uniref:DUF4328 domain-containing protein n=1 Tax=uncultured Cardiobacterium sp. TaxID=417619 RepID=UPI0026134292|nr:DUF4328 domain-containing protein [uncultured Cardiobacterium sp.]
MKDYKYSKLQSLTRYLYGAVCLSLGCLIFEAAYFGFVRFLLAKAKSPNAPHFSLKFLQLIDSLYKIVAVSHAVLLFITAVLVLIWTYRTNANLHFFKAGRIRYKPQETIWCWLIPIISAIAPYQIIKEIWQKSLKLIKNENNLETGIISIWWLSFILGNISGCIGIRWLINNPFDITAINTYVISRMLHVISAILLIKITRAISQAQKNYSEIQNNTIPTDTPALDP